MKWASIAAPVILLIYIMVIINYSNYRQSEFEALKQREYDINVNYACDAAMQEAMREATNSGIDYKDIYAIELNPEFALDTYAECMLRSLGWSITKENKDILYNDYTPYFLVVSDDGYYIFRERKEIQRLELRTGGSMEVSSYENFWTPKLPFSEKNEGSNEVIVYTLQDNYYSRVNLNSGAITTFEEYGKDGNVTTDRRNSVVAKHINTAVNQAIMAKFGTKLECTYNAPVTDTVYVKAVNKPSIHTMFVDTNTLTGRPIVAVAGTRVSISPGYIGYTRNGSTTLFYAPAHYRDEIKAAPYNGSIKRVFSTDIEAALAGFMPDVYFK